MYTEIEKTPSAIRLLRYGGGAAGMRDEQLPLEWGRNIDIAVGTSGPQELSILLGGSVNSSIGAASRRTAAEHVASVRAAASAVVDEQMAARGVELAAVEAAAAELDKANAVAAELAARILAAQSAFDAVLEAYKNPRAEGAALEAVKQEVAPINLWLERLRSKFQDAHAALKTKRAGLWKTTIGSAFSEQRKAIAERRRALQVRAEEVAADFAQELTLLHALESELK